jgi:hypothetical protein
VPWEDSGVGVLAGLVETTKRVLLEPTDFFRRMPVTGGIGRPFTYALVLGYLGVAVAAVYNAIMHAVLGTTFATFTQRPELARYAGMLEGGFGLAVSLILGPVLVAVGLFIGAGITHLCLLLVGGAQRGFEATFRVIAYIQAAAVFSVLPFCGGLIGGVYRIVLAILGLAEAHRISKGTAALAVLLPLLLLCCCCAGGLMLAFGGGFASALRHMPR